MRLRVRLAIPDPTPDEVGSRVRVAVVDTSLADALHPTVAEATTTLERATPDVELVLEIPGTALRQGHRYSLQAHLDHGGTGEIKPGDLIITEDVPIPTGGGPGERQVEARLTRI